ncbi:hypothetical protein PG988_002418 [Apiospora saccharicola]
MATPAMERSVPLPAATENQHHSVQDRISTDQGGVMSFLSTPTAAAAAAAPFPRANSFAIRRRPVSTTHHVNKPATQAFTSPSYSPPPPTTATTATTATTVTAGTSATHNGNMGGTTMYCAADSFATPPLTPGIPASSSSDVVASTAAPLPPQSPENKYIPPPPPGPPPRSQAPILNASRTGLPTNEHPQQQQQTMMHFPPPPGQSAEPSLSSGSSASSTSSPTIAATPSSSSSASMIPPYNPAYATTQLPYTHQQNSDQGKGKGKSKENAMPMPSLGPAATPSFGLSMNGPTIPLISSRPDNFRRISKYINKESAKKACKTGYGYLAKTGEWVDRIAQPAMPLLAATNPDIAAMYQLQQALRPGLQQQQQQQQLGTAGASSSSSGNTGLAAVGGLAAAGLAGYAMLQGMGGDDFTTTPDSSSGLDTFAQILAGATQQQQPQPDLSAPLQGAAGGQQSDPMSAILQQQQQQSGDTIASLLGSLVGGIAQGGQADASQQIMDAIQQQSAASTQALLSAIQNDSSSAQGQQDFATQLLGALSQQQQQPPQAQADLLAVIQQQQAASTQALLAAIQGTSTSGQDYGSQAFASILQQQQQQQAATTQAFLSNIQQQTNPAPSGAQQSSTLSPQEHVAYEEQLLNAALQQQQQQQYGASSFASSDPTTQPGEGFTNTASQPATNPPQADPAGATQYPYSPNFSYNHSWGPTQYQQPFATQHISMPNPNQHTGPTHNSNCPGMPQHHVQAQPYAQQDPSAPSLSYIPTSNPVATTPIQQQIPPSGHDVFQGPSSHGQVEPAQYHHNPQTSAPPQQQTQQAIPPVTTESMGIADSSVQAAASIAPPVPQPQNSVYQGTPQVEQNHGASMNNSNKPEVALIQQPSQPLSFHGQLSTDINISPCVKLEFNVSQPPTTTSLDTPILPAGPSIPDLAAGPRPPLDTDKTPWTRHHLPIFGIESILLPPETTLQEASPHILTGELDAHHGISFEIRLLYDTGHIEHETRSLRSAVSTQDVVVIEPYSSYSSSPASMPYSSPKSPVPPSNATFEKEAEAPCEGSTDAVIDTIAKYDLDIIAQSQIHAITLASTIPDADGDIVALHKLVIVPSSSTLRASTPCFNHGLVFSFYAPLLPPPDLDPSPVKQLAAVVMESIVSADRNTA